MSARDRRQLALMLAPYLIGLTVLVLAPSAVSLGMAFTEYDLIGPARWVGLANFAELATSIPFRAALVNSLVFAAIAVPLRVALALGLALLLHHRVQTGGASSGGGGGAARTIATVPTAVPEIAYGLLWLWLFNPMYGPVNQLLRWVGADTPAWLTAPNDARAAIIIMSLFTIGEMFVVFLAARRAVPREVYELAALEGASGWTLARRITLPVLAPVIGLLALRDVIAGFQLSFVPALVVTEGGPPPYSTTYLSLYIYRNAFEYLRYGYAAAATVVMLALTAAAAYLQWRLSRRYRGRI